MTDYRVTPRTTAQYRCWCGDAITVNVFDGWGHQADRYEYPDAEKDEYGRYHCPNRECRAVLAMRWLGQRPVK